MAYLMLIVEQREDRRNRSDAEGRAAYESMVRFSDELYARGVLKASEALKPDSEGVRLAVRNGRRSLVDGPFTESKEMVGGFFLLDCATKDEALAIAGECPAVGWATVEVRELAPCYERGS